MEASYTVENHHLASIEPLDREEWERLRQLALDHTNAVLADDRILSDSKYVELFEFCEHLTAKHGEQPVVLEILADFTGDPRVQVELYSRASVAAWERRMPRHSIHTSWARVVLEELETFGTSEPAPPEHPGHSVEAVERRLNLSPLEDPKRLRQAQAGASLISASGGNLEVVTPVASATAAPLAEVERHLDQGLFERRESLGFPARSVASTWRRPRGKPNHGRARRHPSPLDASRGPRQPPAAVAAALRLRLAVCGPRLRAAKSPEPSAGLSDRAARASPGRGP
jgi:hypothetical protein